MNLHSLSVWAILPEALPSVLRLMAGQTDENLPSQVPARLPGKVAVVPIRGVLTNYGPATHSGSYHAISSAVERAAQDPGVSRIILSVDSPGGDILGLPETAAVIAAAAKVKQVSAIVEGLSASAAYWLSSQASDITVTPSGQVGSVGVRTMHVDMTKLMADSGYKLTEIHAGEFKTEGSPYKPLSDAAQAHLQTRVDLSHREFLDAVARGRGGRASREMRTKRFGEGRMLSSTDALKHGLVDAVQAPRAFYQGLSAPDGKARLGAIRARVTLERIKS